MNLLTSQILVEEVLNKVQAYVSQHQLRFAIIKTSQDPASRLYIKKKISSAAKLGIEGVEIDLSLANLEQVLQKIYSLNSDNSIHGIIAQLPLNSKLSSNKQQILDTVNSQKDIDGLCSINQGLLATKQENICLTSATALSILTLITSKVQDLTGQKVVVINDSNLIGKPLTSLLLNRSATVTICNEFTQNLTQIINDSDILVTAIGKPKLIKISKDFKGKIIVDAGVSKVEDQILGDIDLTTIEDKEDILVTPPTGAVGPLTVAKLLENLVKAYQIQNQK